MSLSVYEVVLILTYVSISQIYTKYFKSQNIPAKILSNSTGGNNTAATGVILTIGGIPIHTAQDTDRRESYLSIF